MGNHIVGQGLQVNNWNIKISGQMAHLLQFRTCLTYCVFSQLFIATNHHSCSLYYFVKSFVECLSYSFEHNFGCPYIACHLWIKASHSQRVLPFPLLHSLHLRSPLYFFQESSKRITSSEKPYNYSQTISVLLKQIFRFFLCEGFPVFASGYILFLFLIGSFPNLVSYQ